MRSAVAESKHSDAMLNDERNIMKLRSIAALMILSVSIFTITATVSANPGDLDWTFGSGGTVDLNPASQSRNYLAVRQQTDGKLIVFGHILNSHGIYVLSVKSLLTNGAVDTSFGYMGSATKYQIPEDPSILGRANDGAILPDGKILVAGDYLEDGVRRPVVWRFSASGDLDETFGTYGMVQLATDAGTAYKIAIYQTKIFVLYSRPGGTYLTRRNSTGTLDIAFGSFGNVTLSASQINGGLKVAPADGKIYVNLGRVKRYNYSGSSDSSYGIFGTASNPVITNVCSYFPDPLGFTMTSIGFTSNGKLYASGVVFQWAPGVPYYFYSAFITRYTSAGQIDSTFNNGVPVCSGDGAGAAFYDKGLVGPQSDGKVVFAYSTYPNGGNNLRRLNSNGIYDFTYNPIDVASSQTDLLIQHTDGKAVVLFSDTIQRFMP
jgi:uncharacterized delta-60 repeat protein